MQQPYTTAGIATRRIGRGDQVETDINVWNGTALADSEEVAKALTLEAMLVDWPTTDGWEKHAAFVRLINDDLLREWAMNR